MAETLNHLLEVTYAAGSSLTALFLVWVYGPKLLRRFFWNLPKTLLGWLMLPVSLAASLLLGIVGLGFATFLWPLTATVLLRNFLHQREKSLRAQSEEYEGLLEEIRGDHLIQE